MFFGLIIFTFLLFVRPVDFFPVLASLHLARLTAIVLSIGLIWSLRKRTLSSFFDSNTTRCLTFFFGIMCLSMFTSIWKSNTLSALVMFGKVYLGYLLVTNTVATLKQFRSLIFTMVFSGGILAFLAVKGYHDGTLLIVNGRMFASFSSLVGDPNYFSQMLLMLIPFAVYMMFGKETTKFQKIICLFYLALSLYSIMLTGSRGGALGLAVVGLLFVLRSRQKVVMLTIIFIFALVSWNFAPDSYKERVYSIKTASVEDDAAISRLNAWTAGWNMMKDRVFGVGVGNFGEGFVLYRPEGAVDPGGMRRAAHNLFFQVGGETGFPGVFIFILMLLFSFQCLSNLKKKLQGKNMSGEVKETVLYIDATFISLAGFCVTGFFLSMAYSWFLYYLIAFSVVLENFTKISRASESWVSSAQVPQTPSRALQGQGQRGSDNQRNSRKWKSRAMSAKL